ncbi:uncharacterized protein ank2a isoform X1 [Syngnathus scovelli]|uniref:uncharacterized protein ank2a isoform X1 n=1 Tax=Syngnathus scovelli TaxID=161590 RepID=UPI0035CA29F1
MESKATRVYVGYKVKDQQISCSTRVSKPFHGSDQCQVKEKSNQNISGTLNANKNQWSPETLKLPSSGSISDISLILSESDQAETDFEEIHENYISQISTLKLPTERLKGTSGPTEFASPKIHQETLKITEDNTDIDKNNEVLQKCLDEFEVPLFKEFHGHPKSPWGHNVNMGYDPFTSSDGNPKTQVNNVGFQDNIYFIDDDDDVLTVATTVAPTKYQLLDDSKNTHMACDSTESSDICSSISPNTEKCTAKTVSSSLYLPIYTRQTSDYDETSSTSIDYDTCVHEKCSSPVEFWTLNETLPRLASPESVMSISDYRAMSPDSPLSKRKGFTDLPVMDVSWALYSSSYKCTSPDLKITENITDPNPNVCDSKTQFGGTDKPAENFVSRVAEHSSSLPDSVLIQQDFPSLSSNVLPFECLHEETSFNRNALLGLATINREYELSDMDWRPSSPQSQTSQHSFSFLELLHSESTRSQLMSQHCDYFLQYSGDTQPLPQMTQDPTELTNVRSFEIKLSLGRIYPQDDNSKTSNAFLSQDVAHSREKSDLQYYANVSGSHKTECYDENDLNAEKPESLQRITEVMIDKVGRESVNGKQMSIQSRPQDLEESKNTLESYLDYWFSKFAPQPCALQPSTYDPEPCISDLRKNTVEDNQNKDSVESSWMKQSTEVNIYSEHKLHRPSTEMATSLSQIQSMKPVIFNLVERPQYTLQFQKDKTMTICKETPSDVEDLVQSKWQEYPVSSSTEVGVSIINSFLCSELIEQEKDKHCNFFLNYNGDNLQPRNEHSDLSLKHSFENSKPKIHYSCSSEKEAFRKETEVSLILGQPQSCARPFTYADVVRGFTREKTADAMAFESRAILLMTDSFDEFSDSSTTELAIGERPYSPESVASLCELTALSPDSPVPQFDIAQIENHGIDRRSYTPQSSVSDWEGRDFCLTNLFDETRPLSPQSVSSDMELDLLFSNRALSPDSVFSDLDTALFKDWLLDFRASSPESVASVKKFLYSPNLQHCNYYLRYSEDRPDSSLSSLSDVEYSELSIKDLFDDSRPESPDSVSSENFRTENKVSLMFGQPQSCARPFTYADVVRGFTQEKPADGTVFESRPILLMTDSFDEFSDSSTTELDIGERPYSPESIASLCELTALSPDSPVPQFDIAQIENQGQCIDQRSYTPQSSVSDWEGHDFCLTNLFDETRPLSPQSVSSDMELDLLFSNSALSPDSVSSDLDTALLRDWLLDFRASSPESVASVEKCSYCPNLQHCNYYLRYSEDRPDSSLSSLSDVAYSELCIKDLFDDSRPESPDSVSSENLRTETKVSLILGQPQSCARPFTYADVVRGLTREKQADTTAFESRPILLMTDSFDEFSEFSRTELAIGERPYSPESVASLCELTALSPDSPVPQFDIAQIDNQGQCIDQRSYTPQSSVSDWEGRDLCRTNLFDETRPLSPQSVSSDMELDLLFSKRALSPDSVSSDLDTALLRDWLLDFRASSPESVGSVKKCLYSPDLQHCNYYLRYSEDRPVSPLSSLSDVECSEICIKDLFDDSRPESPDSVSSENFRTETKVSLMLGQPQSCARPFTYADVVRGFTQENPADAMHNVTAFESRPILLMTDSFDKFSDSSTTEFAVGERSYSPESLASLCELTALSPDSPVPHFDIAQIDNQGQCIDQRSYTPQSSVSDWEGRDFCLSNLFDETRPLSPQSVSSDMELDLLFSNRALSPDSISSDLDTELLRDWLLDFRASSPESVASVEKCSYCPDLQHCNYYLRYSEDRPDSSLSSLSDVEYSELYIKDLFDDSRPESPDSVSSENFRTETKVSLIIDQPQSCAGPFTYADVVRGFTQEKTADAMYNVTAFESRAVLLMTDSFDELSDSSISELAIGERPYSPESVASLSELTALSPDSPVPQFDIALIENHGQCIDQRSYTPQSSVSDWEGHDFCLTNLFDETRPLSPQSVSSDMELDLLFSDRALSPDSVSSDLDTTLLRDWLLDFRASSPESVASVKKCSYSLDLQHCDYYLSYSEDRPDSSLSSLSDVEYSELCIKDLFDDSRPESPDSVSSENFRTETKVSLLLGQPQSCARPFTYADVVRCFTREKTADGTVFESRPILLMTDSFDEFSDSSTTELDIGERPYSPESIASLSELTALSPDSPVPQFDISQIEYHGIDQRSYTPQSSVSDWEGCDFCLINLFDETRPLSPQSVSSDMELDLLFSNRALSPDSVSSDLDTALLRDWLLDFRASSPESVASVKKCSYSLDLQHCDYYLSYSEDRPDSSLSSLSDVEYSELCIKDLFDDSRPESPDSISSENFRTETKVSLLFGQPQSCARPFTYADVVRGFTREKTADGTVFESRPILLMTDSFDEFSDSSTTELDIGERPYSPESIASLCELTALSPDSPVPQFDIAQIENQGQCIDQRSYTPQSGVSDWEGRDFYLTNLFDETRPLSPQSVSSDMELDLLFSNRALSPDSVSSDLDTALLRDWLLDFRASSPESVASVKKCLYGPDLQHCNYYLRYSEDRPDSSLSSLSDVAYSELCIKDLFDDSRPESPDSVSSENSRTETKVSLILGQPQSCARPFTYADVVRGLTREKPADATAFEFRPILLMTESPDEFSDSSISELDIGERPYSPESVASLCEFTALSPDSPVPQFDIAQIDNQGQCIDQRSYTPQSSVSDWEGRDFCLTNLFDETRPLSPQSVSSDMELDHLFSNRALSPDSVSSDLDTALLRDWLLDFRASSPESVASVKKCLYGPDLQHCNYYLRYSENRPDSSLSSLSDVEYSELCIKDLFDDSRPESPDSVSSENFRKETISLILGQPQSCAQPFTYADVVRGFTQGKPAFEARPILLTTDFFDELSDSSISELAIGERPYSPESVASLCELTALSPDSPVPQFDIAQIENRSQWIEQRSYTPQSSVSDWEGRDFCLTNLFDETRPLSPQSVSSDMELDLLFSNRALSPDSVSSDLDTAFLRDWLLDFRASSPESVGSVKKCLYSPDIQHCNYYLRYSEYRAVSPLSSLSDVECSEICIKDLFDDSRPESPDSVSSENFRTETKVSLMLGQPQSCARPFTYADVVRGFTQENPADAMHNVTVFESRPILLMTDSFDEFSDSSTTELDIGERPYSPDSLASLCELTALSPDSPVPQFDIFQIENHGIDRRSYTPQSSVSDWEGRDFCLSNLFDESRPLSPQSVSSDMELDILFSNRALSPDSVSSDLDTALLRDWLLDFRASSPESVASVKKCSYCPNLQHCNYYLRYSEDRPDSSLSSLSDVECSEICIKDLFDDSRPGSPDSVSSENFRTETKVYLMLGQPQSRAGPLTYADVVRGFTQENPADAMYNVTAFESRAVLLMTDSFDELSDSSFSELDIGERPYSPESVASLCEFTALSPDSPVPQFDIAQIENQGIDRRSYTPQSSVSDWEGRDLCRTNLFDETRPLSPQSVSSDMELDLLFSKRALSPDSVSSDLDTALLRDWLLDFRASSPESVGSVKKCLYSPDLQHCNYYLRYSEDRPVSPLSSLSDVECSEICIKDLFDDSRPESPDSVSSENFRTETKVSLMLGQPQSCARPFTYADVVRGFTQENPTDAMHHVTAFESRPRLLMTDSFDKFSDSSTTEFAVGERSYSPESLASLCELTALSPDSPVPHFDIALIDNQGQYIDRRSYTPQSSVSDWEGRDFCLSNLFDESRPLSPQSVSSDMELHLLFSNRALSPDSISSDLDTALLRDWLLDFRASSPESVASVKKCLSYPNLQHCNYYLRYSEDRPDFSPSSLSDVEYSELCIKDLFDDSRPESPDSVSSENFRKETKVPLMSGQPQSSARPFTYADVVRGFTQEKTADAMHNVTAFESRPILLMTDSFDKFSDSSTTELDIGERPYSPESVASLYELTALSPDSPVPQFDIAQIENRGINQRSYTPQSSVSDWEGRDFCLTNLFDETRPLSPKSVSSDMELDLLFINNALSPDSVSSALDTSLQRVLLDFKASSPDSAASVEEFSFFSDMIFDQNNRQHCNYYLRYSEDRPVPLPSTLSYAESSELCLKYFSDDNSVTNADQCQFHRSTFTPANVSSMSPVFKDLHPYKKLISPLLDPLYKGNCSSFQMFLNLDEEEKSNYDPQPAASFLVVEEPSKVSLCSFTTMNTNLPIQQSTCFTDNFTTQSCPSDCQILPSSYQLLPVSSDASVLDQKFVGQCHDEIKPDSSKPVLDIETQNLTPHQNMDNQSFIDPCLSELKPSVPEILDSEECLKQQSEKYLIDQSVDTDPRPLYKQFHKKLMAHIYDPVYRREHVCDTFMSGVTAFDKGFEKTSAQSNDKCLTANEENQFLKESSNFELVNSIKPQLNEATSDNNRQPELSHMPSVKENMDIPDDFKVKEAFSKQTQTRNETMEERPLSIVHKGTATISPLMMIYNQDVPFKDMTRQSEKMDQSSSLPVSTSSSKTNLCQPKDEKHPDFECFATNIQSMHFNESTLCGNIELPTADIFYQSKTQSEVSPTTKTGLPKTADKEGLIFLEKCEGFSSMAKAQDSVEEEMMTSSSSTPTLPGFESTQLDYLPSDLEEIKMTQDELSSKILCPHSSQPNDKSSKGNQIHEYEELQLRCLSVSASMQQDDTDKSFTSDVRKASYSKGSEDIPSNLSEEYFKSDVQDQVHKSKLLSSETEEPSRKSLQDLSKETSEMPSQETATFASFEKLIPCSTSAKSEMSSHEISSLACVHHLETTTSGSHFVFEDQFQTDEYSDEVDSRANLEDLEESLASVDNDIPDSQPSSIETKTLTSSTSDEYTVLPDDTATSTHVPPEYEDVCIDKHGPSSEYSDPEHYFDCLQAVSDFSETEPDEQEIPSSSNKSQLWDDRSYPEEKKTVYRHMLLSSGSEDYEDASVLQEVVPTESEDVLFQSDASLEEFTLCDLPSSKLRAYDDNNSLTREINAEIGSMSESSDDEFLSTRIVRRRVVIQADEMPDIPTQTVTEEKYQDEDGHIVIRTVTRKIIRKCVSSDGVEREEVSIEGSPQRSISVTEGDGYSKVVKRTILKSEGDHTEVTFAESEGFSASQATAEVRKVSLAERTTVVEGKRTVAHKGDLSLASDLPSAEEDFNQALGYIGDFTRAELPHVVESETVKDDGTVIRRAHMHKGQTLRRTVVQGGGQPKQVLLEQVDGPTKGSRPHELQQHLHQLFHHYYEEHREDDDSEEEEKQ